MRKTPFYVFFTAALVVISLAACAPAKSPTVTATATATALPATSAPTQAGVAGCTVESSLIPTADPTQLAQYPPPSKDDWSMGPEAADITFIEYGDYQ